jgi:hypothetical protein
VLPIAALPGCSSSYMPQQRGRVAVIMQDGKPAYVRDGKTYDHGLLGGGLVDAVRGNPGAERAANEYHDRMSSGLIGVLGGTACMVGSIIYAGKELSDGEPEGSHGNADKALWLALGCTVVMLVGTGYMASAEPYRWDAINIFNDTTPQPPMQLPGSPGYGGWSTQRQQSLKMRDGTTAPTAAPTTTIPPAPSDDPDPPSELVHSVQAGH